MKTNYLKVLLIIGCGLILLACMTSSVESNEPSESQEDASTYQENATEAVVEDLEAVENSETDAADNAEAALDDTWDEEDDAVYLVYYDVVGSDLSEPYYYDLTDDTYSSQQEDTDYQQDLWDYAKLIFPKHYLKQIDQVIFFTDDVDNDLASVEPLDYESASKWILYMDVMDAGDRNWFAQTLTHELGHLMTLELNQFDSAGAACQTYETDYGCFAPSSYIADFVDQFWTDLLPEFQEIEANSSSQEEFDVQITDFYNNYWDQFVSEYAATNPEEDFSESWNWYVFELEPEGDGQIAWDKIAFFDQYPELVKIAEQIRANVK